MPHEKNKKLYWFANCDLKTGKVIKRAAWEATSVKEAVQKVLYTLRLKNEAWQIGPSGRTLVMPGGDETWVLQKIESRKEIFNQE